MKLHSMLLFLVTLLFVAFAQATDSKDSDFQKRQAELHVWMQDLRTIKEKSQREILGIIPVEQLLSTATLVRPREDGDFEPYENVTNAQPPFILVLLAKDLASPIWKKKYGKVAEIGRAHV